MFGKRSDGKKVKGLDGITRLMPLFMKTREDATNRFKLTIETEHLDEFIAAKRGEGKNYTYRDIILTALVRCYKKFPRLNRFIKKGNIYQRNHIDMSMNVHKSLRTGDEEVVVKTRYTGYETLDEVSEILSKEINRAIAGNESDALASFLAKMPHFFLSAFVGFVKLFDRWGLWSNKFLFEISPFHTSFYFTDLKSVHLDYCYHHLYNFGTCGLFAAMGKEKMITSVKDGEIVTEKVLEIGISEDERFVDGLYFARALKYMRRICQNPSSLEVPLEESEINHIKTPKELKKEKKEKKLAEKEKKKAEKK